VVEVVERLTALDASFLYAEEATTPMHVGSVAIFDPPDEGFDYARLAALVEERLVLVPRFRRKIRPIPVGLGRPVWVDDTQFDLGFHLRRSAIPRSAGDHYLTALVSRVISRRLDRSRPLWEVYLVEGLGGGRVALVSKTHPALVDGAEAVDLTQVVLEPEQSARGAEQLPLWSPEPTPSGAELVLDAVGELIRRPSELAATARAAFFDARTTAGRVAGVARSLVSTARTAARPAPDTPLNVEIGQQRRVALARTNLDDYKRIRKAHGGSINDVVLATVAGALRAWLLTRAEPVRPSSIVRAMIPVSVHTGEERSLTSVSPHLVDLPVGESNPVVRLHQISYAMKGHKEGGRSVGANALIALSGFASPTLHALGARAASGLSRKLFNLVITNVPGPQHPLYAGAARMVEVFPIVPLARGQALAIGLTSYDGGVYFGLNGDWDAMPDLDLLAELISESLEELLETVR
jgi:diacylglycerol O-acyltransferase